MAVAKGAVMEELVRAYFARQGYYVLRSVPYRFEGEDVTDIDVWLYSRQAATARIRGIVDVKNKKSPKAFERVLWVKGIQAALGCDRAFVATTDTNPKSAKFAHAQRIGVLSKDFLGRLEKKLDLDKRLTLEQFVDIVQLYPDHKADGDWLRILADTKSAVASLTGFAAFNKAMFAFRYFAERAEVRLKHRDVAVRCALITAGLACIALDSAVERFAFEDQTRRYDGLVDGIMYGDAGDGRVRGSIDTALQALAQGMENGKAIAAQARTQLEKRLSDIRADVIAEFFVREQNAQHLFSVGKEFDDAAYDVRSEPNPMSLEARSILGVFVDYVGVPRAVLPVGTPPVSSAAAAGEGPAESRESVGADTHESAGQKTLL